MSEKKAGLFKTTVSVSLLVIVGKILGFWREALIAAYYGATAETDAFFFAQSMPNMIFPAISGGLSTAMTSLYVKRLENCGEYSGDRYVSRLLNGLILLGCGLGFAGFMVSPLLVSLLAPGFTGSQAALASLLSRIVMVSFPLYFMNYMLGAVLNSRRVFISSQVAGLLYNLTIILLTIAFGQERGALFLCAATALGTVAQFMCLLFLCARSRFHYTLCVNPFHVDTAELFRLALPIMLGNSVVQLNNIVDKALGSLQPEGSLSTLSYASSLDALVISIFVTSLSTVLYPTLTSMAASSNQTEYGKTLLQSLSGLTLILLPISCITLLVADDVVNIVYARGSFDQTAVSYTSAVLTCYAPQFLFVGVREVLTRGFFALQDTKTPSVNSAIGVGCNIVFSLIFVRWLGLQGIAMGTSLSALVSAVLLLHRARVRLPELRFSAFYRQLAKQAAAGLALMLILSIFRRLFPVSNALLHFALSTLIGFSVYFTALLLVDRKGSREILSSLLRRMKKGSRTES